MSDPVTGFRSVPQTVPVTVDVDTTLSVLHKGRRSRVSTVSHRRKRVVSDVSDYSSTSGSSSYDSSSTSNSPHHYRRGRRSRSQTWRNCRSAGPDRQILIWSGRFNKNVGPGDRQNVK
ncbi:hypothetical protein DPMN_059314 [Dreissena polymorpha]|uniref:Uncharacterized protein n=1 Tax=Dreissena polymorpha TaxID=45954 RepID=A0A9D4C3L9_DREPO|nr:hypothetical protein DPMN_059314 [Dreissena polymorpha]